MLTRRWLPGDTANAIEAKQAEFRAQPEIAIGRLGHREDGADGEPVPGSPRSVPVLADIQRWVQRQNRSRPEQEDERADRNERQRRFHLRGRPFNIELLWTNFADVMPDTRRITS